MSAPTVLPKGLMSTDDSTNAPDAEDSAAPEPHSVEVTPTGPVSTVPGRREAVREKALQVRVRQSRMRMARRAALITGALAVLAAVAIAVAWAVGGVTGRPQLSPEGAQQDGFAVTTVFRAQSVTPADGATPVEQPPAPTTTAAPVAIHVYVDYLSPSAREWQLANATQLSNWVEDGAATLTYHPVAMLTAKSNGTKYSLRAAGAAACVATYAPGSLFGFNNDLLTRQPAVDSDGFSDKMLADIAQANGADDPKPLRDCIQTQAFTGWVKAATERAVAGIDGATGLSLTGNSLVTVNGQPYVGDASDPAEFSQFVLTSASGKASKTQSPTPTPSASATP